MGHFSAPGSEIKRVNSRRLKPSTGQDVVYMTTNLVPTGSSTNAAAANTVTFTINDEVAPVSNSLDSVCF